MRLVTSSPRIYTDEHGLRAEIEVGILFNFGPKAEFRRYVFDNEKKNPRKSVLIRGKEVRKEVS